ncbi:hypothetical protein E2C01_024385 [Portunus trituberculatus]|uniref:Uncharacterized protein n=1 Tax=Portunus trituberculatus TaxID=210409 RepID=A0A5B7ED11_PORTR|nr:hypothetical protein [Portunus trituberculatus]
MMGLCKVRFVKRPPPAPAPALAPFPLMSRDTEAYMEGRLENKRFVFGGGHEAARHAASVFSISQHVTPNHGTGSPLITNQDRLHLDSR